MKLKKIMAVFMGLFFAVVLSFGFSLYLQKQTVEKQAQKIKELEQKISELVGQKNTLETQPNIPVSTASNQNPNTSVGIAKPSRSNNNRAAYKTRASGKIVRMKDGVYTITQENKAELLGARFGELLSTASIVPNIQNGEFEGFVFKMIKPKSIYTEFDLQVGDVVHSINGQKLASIGQTNSLLASLRQKDRFDVEIDRQGRRVMIPIEIK